MGKSYLSAGELLSIFPTIKTLILASKGYSADEWGLRQDGRITNFGPAEKGWLLQMPLSIIQERAEVTFGPYFLPDSVIFYYDVEPITNNLEFDVVWIQDPDDTLEALAITNMSAFLPRPPPPS